MISGEWVTRFADASHGVVTGISLDAQWRHSILGIEWLSKKTIKFFDYPEPLIIRKDRHGREFVWMVNTCPIGVAFNCKPAKHRAYAFKDECTKRATQKEGTDASNTT